MATEVATIDVQPIRSANPMDMMPSEFKGGLQRRGDNRKALMSWIREALVDGVDFGVIQTKRGPSKPSLRKPGAEKICGMLGVTATFPTLKDYEGAALDGREIRQIILRCHLIAPTGEIVADGVGARSVEQDYGDLNKALKMASKSAHIDATLRMAGLSEVFTQDIEDMPKERLESQDQPQQRTQPPAQAKTAAPQQTERVATDKQVGLLIKKCKDAGVTPAALSEQFGVPALEDLPFSKVNPALSWLDGQKTRVATRAAAPTPATDFDEGEPPYSEAEVARYAR